MPRPKKTAAEGQDTQAKDTKKTKGSLNLTPDQQALAERVAAQDDSWWTIREDEIQDFSLMENPFDLMPEAQKLQDERKYAFRWCENTTKRVDYLCRSKQPPFRWSIANSTNLPELRGYIDNMTGAIHREDQVLLCKPWHFHELVKKAKQDLAEAQDRSGDLSQGARERIMSSRDNDVEVMAGKQYKITSSDEVMADASTYEGLDDGDSGLGDLITDE